MLGATPLSAVLGAAPPPDAPTAQLKSFIRAAADAGLALLLVAPGEKRPIDARTPQQRTKDDKAAQDAAREAGRPDWIKARSRAGAYLATTDSARVIRYLERARKTLYKDEFAPVNFAVEVGASRLVLVDCDTSEERRAFLDDFAGGQDLPPTVTTPGSVDESGQWAHYDGGHYYFTLPEGYELPPGPGSWTGPGGYVVSWRGRYALIPPSRRPEGDYELTGREYELPDTLRARIDGHAAERAARVAARESDPAAQELDAAIIAWGQRVPWADLLEPAGWTLTARPDSCGCDVWTAPGTHHSPKSATAHDNGCTEGRYTVGNEPLYVWTDNPGEPVAAWIAEHGKTVSKLNLYAVLHHDGDVGVACAEIGVIPGQDKLALELGVSAKNIDPDADLSPAVDNAGENGVTNPGCRHQAVSPIGRCYSCGDPVGPPSPDLSPEPVDVVPQDDAADPFAHPEPVTDEADDVDDPAPAGEVPGQPEAPALDLAEVDGQCEGCGQPVPHAEVYTAADGVRWHATADGDDHVFAAAVLEVDATDDTVLQSDIRGVPLIAPFRYWRDYPAPEYAIDGLIEHRGFGALIGPPGVGKSAVALDIACSLAAGIRWQGRETMRQRVLYLPGEGLSGAVQRVKAWEDAHGIEVGEDLLLGDSIIQLGASNEAWAAVVAHLLKHPVGLIIFDTFARMSLGLEENSASDVGRGVLRFDQLRKATGAGVLVVHHTAKNSSSGRGSSALLGSLDYELLVQEGQMDVSELGPRHKSIELLTTKVKNAPELDEPLPMILAPHEPSMIVTGPSGVVGDPFAGVSAPVLLPESVVETAIRLRVFADRFPEQGVTRGDLIAGVQVDPFTASRPHTEVRWKQKVHEAVDLALRYGLLETLSGKATGMRYVSSSTTAEQARARAGAEAMDSPVEEANTDGN